MTHKDLQHYLVTAVLIERGKLLLTLRKNTGFADGLWSLPMGHVERGESARRALARECKEELGIEVTEAQPVAQFEDKTASVFNQIFMIKQYRGEVKNCEPQKCSGLDWYAIERLPENANPVTEKILKTLKNEPIAFA